MQLPNFTKIGRSAVCILLVLLFFLVYEVRLFQWQIIEGEEYKQIALSTSTDTMEVSATRGEVLDRNGEVLAGNRMSYSIVYNALYMDYTQRNATIVKVIDLLEELGEEWRNPLPIELDSEGNYKFCEDRESDIATLKSPDMLNLADYATAEDCINALSDKYSCHGFSNEDTLKVLSVRYSMTRDAYSRTNPYVIASDVSAETVGIFSEREDEWPGIETRVGSSRYYGEDGSLAPHIVGSVGQIQADQYTAAVENGTAYDAETNISGYKISDTIGRSGIEQVYEEQLRGSRGLESIYTDDNGEVQSTAMTVQPEEGNTVHLTLDSNLQRAANISLKKNIEGNTDARDATAGAVVVLDVEDFGVLASSSYPTYDMNLYITDAEYNTELNSDTEEAPLFDRALNGTFTPGSVFKPLVALAALQEGVISAGTTHYCNKLFEYYDLKLACTGVHQDANLYRAIASSCNVYFCNVGLDLTIRKMDAYAEYFGLGEKTGVELHEAEGIMSNPQDYFNIHGVNWTDGMSAQTAIGQADNRFTPVQLATYCATIANDGVRLQTHFLKEITDYTREETIETYEPVELYDAGLTPDVLGVVREGMRQTSTSGTARDVFANYPVSVISKTGTAETSSNPDKGGTQPNLSFICYAPAEDPEIAIAVVLEYGNEGSYAKNVAKDILDQYFGFYTWDKDGYRYDSEGNRVDDDGEIIKTKEELDAEKAAEEGKKNTDDDTESAPESAPESGTESAPEQGRDNIPDAPFTGDVASAPDTSDKQEDDENSDGESDDDESSDDTAEDDGKLDSPYYTGGG